jgi:cell division protein YceG involved in septum cleavage
MSFKSTAEIHRRIHAIESTLKSGLFTLSEECQMLQEVAKLLKMRKASENMDITSGNDVANLRLRLDQIKLLQGDAEARITAKKEEINTVNAQIDALNGIRAAEQAKRADSKTEIKELRKELDAEYAKKKAAWDEYSQAKAAKKAAYVARNASNAIQEEQARVALAEIEIDGLE